MTFTLQDDHRDLAHLADARSGFIRTAARIDRFAATLPAFKAAHLINGELTVLLEALNCASGSDTEERFGCNMDVAVKALDRLEAALPALRAEIARGKQQPQSEAA